MSQDNGRFFTVTSNDGKTVEYEILFTFDTEDAKKSYIVFTDHNKNKDGSIITYAATYAKENEKLELKDIETEEEWHLIETILSQIEEKISEN